jgi:predicted dehydrogenase
MKQHSSNSRRQFLKKAGLAAVGAVGAPLFIPSRVFGRNGVVAPGSKINIACIGVGNMGTSNMNAFLQKQDAQIVAVCDVDSSRRDIARDTINKHYGTKGCAVYADFRELLTRGDLDAVSIAVPDHWHALLAVSAIKAGLDVYGEKPLAFSIHEGRAIVDATQRYGTIWQTGSWQRSQRNFRHACELVRNGRIGKVHTVRVGLPDGYSINDNGGYGVTTPPPGFDYEMWLGPAPKTPYIPNRCHWNFRWISDYAGGMITDWAGHHCDIAQWGMGTELSSPVEIEGLGEYPDAADGLFDTPTKYSFTCKYAEGFTMIVADRTKQPKGMGVQFEGTEGWIWVERGDALESSIPNLPSSVIAPGEIHLYKSDDHHQNFLDCVRTRQKTITPAEVAHRSIMIGHLGLIAMKLGRKVRWNPVTERFLDDPEADRLLARPMRGHWHL